MDTPQTTSQPREFKIGRIYGILTLCLIFVILMVPKFVSANSNQRDDDQTVIVEELIPSTNAPLNTVDTFQKVKNIEIGQLKVQSLSKFFNLKERTNIYELDINFPEPIQSVTQL